MRSLRPAPDIHHAIMSKKNIQRGHRSPAPISLRLSAEEKTQLETAAKGQTISAYIRSRLFHPILESQDCGRDASRLSPRARQTLLARMLAELGRQGFAKSLGDIAEAARAGVLPLSPDVLETVDVACRHIRDLRKHLMIALGSKREDPQ